MQSAGSSPRGTLVQQQQQLKKSSLPSLYPAPRLQEEEECDEAARDLVEAARRLSPDDEAAKKLVAMFGKLC